MWARAILVAAFILLVGAGLARMHGERDPRPAPSALAMRVDAPTRSVLHPGGDPAAASKPQNTGYEESGAAVAEGKRLYSWMNCVGCHAHGGGAIGPALMDDVWIYGSEPRAIHDTIAQGRPNGMPAFGSKLPDEQIWQLTAYVRSMSGLVPVWAKPGRDDDLAAKPAESNVSRQPPTDQPGQTR
jgi:cytochrome c oxidase cbb3-type subunit 3